MDKKYRDKLLEKLSASSQGEALRELFKEKIAELKEEGTEKSKTFDEVLGCRKAVEKLKAILHKLKLEKKQTKNNNQYL